MSIEIWTAFVVTSTVLLVVPGPTVLTVISYSLSHGNRATIPLVIAVAFGDITALSLSLLGLGALLAQSAIWFQAIKWLGCLYLLYLGIRLIKSGLNPSELALSNPRSSSKKLFFDTWLVTALNPKGIIFFIAFLPQFVSSTENMTGQLWILAVTFITLAALNTTFYAVFAGKARQLMTAPGSRRTFNFTGGSLLAVAGLWALNARRT